MNLEQLRCPNCKKTHSPKCRACKSTGYIPGLILDSLEENFPASFSDIIKKLTWKTDYFSFDLQCFEVRIETDGLITFASKEKAQNDG